MSRNVVTPDIEAMSTAKTGIKKREPIMGRVEFTNENKKSTTNYDYPKLKLAQGEKARLVVGLEAPVMEYVHTLRKPTLMNGVPQMETLKRKNGDEYQAHKKDFIGTPICLGDEAVLEEKASDPKNCPVCKLAAESSDYTDAPKRRYAMHVMRYRTKGNTADIQTPFSVELLVWSFTQTVFNKLTDIRNDIDSGDLRKHDLILGPCTNVGFQQFDITPSLKKAEWMADKERGALFLETWRENQIPDLTIAIGNNKQKSWLDQDIETIRDAWKEVQAYEARGSAADLDTDLSTLLDKDEPKTDDDGWALPETDDADEATGETEDDNDILSKLGSDQDAPASEDEAAEEPAEEPADEPAPKKAPAKRAPAKKPAAETAVNNFDDLLAQMD